VDQRAFFEGKQKNSNREGFLYWMGDTLDGVKWQNFKMVFVLQQTLSDPGLQLATPHLVAVTGIWVPVLPLRFSRLTRPFKQHGGLIDTMQVHCERKGG